MNYKFINKSVIFLFFILIFIFIYSKETLAAPQYEKKDIVVLGISSNSQLNDIEYFYRIQTYIYKAFVEMKRFNVIYYPDINIPVSKTSELIENIKKYRIENKDFEEYHQFGDLVFKKEDFDKIVNSFYLVIPEINNYYEEVVTNDDGTNTYKVSFELKIEIIDLKKNLILKEIIIEESDESNNNIQDAQSNCLSSFINEFKFDLKQIEDFKLKTGVLKIDGDKVYIYLGSSIGVKINDEFFIYKKVKFQNDYIKKLIGLIRIYEISDKISIGKILLQLDNIEEGDIVIENNRIFVNLYVYGGYRLLNFESFSDSYYGVSINKADSAFFGAIGFQYYLNYNLFIELGGELDITVPLSYNYFGGLGYSIIYRRINLSAILYGTYYRISTNIFADSDYYYGETAGVRGEIRFEYLLNVFSKLSFGVNYTLTGNINNFYYIDSDSNKIQITNTYAIINFNGLGFYLVYVLRL